MNEKLLRLQSLLAETKPEETITVLRADLEHVVKMADTVGLDVSNLLEGFDATAQGYLGRIRRQLNAINEMIVRRLAIEDALRKLAKDPDISPAVVAAFGTIIDILRNGVKENG